MNIWKKIKSFFKKKSINQPQNSTTPTSNTPPVPLKNYLGSLEYYQELLKTCHINNDKDSLDYIQDVCAKILKNKHRYLYVEAKTEVPWYLIAGIHFRESSLKFDGCLHNGDPLNQVTTHVPKGRGPFSSWEESAIDALGVDRLTDVNDWSIPMCLKMAERYNGTGYLKVGRMSPYVWCLTNHYKSGQYVRDHVFDPNSVSKRPGVVAIMWGLGIFNDPI